MKKFNLSFHCLPKASYFLDKQKMTKIAPQTLKNQISILKTFKTIDSKPHWQKKFPIPQMYNPEIK